MTASRLAIACLLAAVALPATGEMYKWTDEDGSVHYTQTPPPDGNAEVINPDPSVKSGGKSASNSERNDRPKGGKDNRDGNKEDGDKELTPEQKQEKQLAMKQNCDNAREALQKLQSQTRLQYINDEGERAFLSEEQRQQRMDKARGMIEKNCRQ